MTIQNAINEIKNYLTDGEDADDAVNMAAKDFDLNPVLVRRKFIEQMGYIPEDHLTKQMERQNVNEINEMASDAQALARAIKQARNSVTAFNFVSDPRYRRNARLSEDAIGKTFTDKDELYVFAGLRGGASRWPFSGVRVSDGETFRFTNNHSSIVGQL